jgi:hypothetical protein
MTRLHRYAVVWRRGFVGRRGTSRFSTLTKNPAMSTTIATKNATDSEGRSPETEIVWRIIEY